MFEIEKNISNDLPRRQKNLMIGIDGKKMRETWEKIWMPVEDFYITNDFPRERADLILDGFQFQEK